jgi:hypothetical protein
MAKLSKMEKLVAAVKMAQMTLSLMNRTVLKDDVSHTGNATRIAEMATEILAINLKEFVPDHPSTSPIPRMAMVMHHDVPEKWEWKKAKRVAK